MAYRDVARGVDRNSCARVGRRGGAVRARERLVYEIAWFVWLAAWPPCRGRADQDGTPVFQLRSVAKSNAFVSLFFPVEDRIESLVDRETLAALRLDVKQRQGTGAVSA
jgi:hypothetical protein